MPDSFGASQTEVNAIYSIYATYNEQVEGTVGYSTVFSNVSVVANRRAVPVTMQEAGTLESLSIYHHGGTGHALLAVYGDTAGMPGTRLGITASTVIHGTAGWQEFALQTPVAVSSGQTIWLAWVFENDPGMRWIDGTPGRAMSSAAWSGGMPESFGAASTFDGIYSIYATYNTGGDATPPGVVTGLTATAGDEQITLSWTNPGDADLAGVRILRKQGSYPSSPTDGTVVHNGPGTSCVDTNLTNGTTYYYAAFSFDEVPNYSIAVTASGTPVASGVDETVGHATVFPNISTVPNRRAVAVTMSEAGTIESISIYHQGGSGHAILAVYGDTAGKPGTLLGATASTLINSAPGWQTIALQSPVAVSSGRTIWLAWVFEADPGLRWTTGTPGRALSSATWSGGMPSSFGTSQTDVNAIYSIYATYRSQGSVVEATVDNLDAGASSTGTWNVSGASNPYGTNSMVTWAPGSTFTWTADLTLGAAYNVYAWWTQASCRYTAVSYQVRSGSTVLGTINVNQTINGGQWNLLGTYTFTGAASVRVLAAPTSDSSANADAVRFVPAV